MNYIRNNDGDVEPFRNVEPNQSNGFSVFLLFVNKHTWLLKPFYQIVTNTFNILFRRSFKTQNCGHEDPKRGFWFSVEFAVGVFPVPKTKEEEEEEEEEGAEEASVVQLVRTWTGLDSPPPNFRIFSSGILIVLKSLELFQQS